MRSEINERVRLYEKENKEHFEILKDRSMALEAIKNFNFHVSQVFKIESSFFESQKRGIKEGYIVYTDDFNVVTNYEIITLNGDNNYSFNYLEAEKSKSYSKIIEFYDLQNFGKIDLKVILKNNYLTRNKLNVLFEWSEEEGGVYLPNPLEKMVKYYRNKGMRNDLIKDVTEVIKISQSLVKI